MHDRRKIFNRQLISFLNFILNKTYTIDVLKGDTVFIVQCNRFEREGVVKVLEENKKYIQNLLSVNLPVTVDTSEYRNPCIKILNSTY